MPAEHLRPNGSLAQGYFCDRCGAPGMNMVGSGHGVGHCEPQPELVAQLWEINRHGQAPKAKETK